MTVTTQRGAEAGFMFRSGLNRGALLVIGFEFMERFGFYSALSLLALFLTARPGLGGLGWNEAQALGVVGLYSGAMYGLPVFGGTFADRVLGHRRAIALGGTAMAGGYLLFTAAALSAARGAPNGWTLPAFWSAFLLLVLGNSLVKATLVVVLGDTFERGDPRRDRAYAYYYMGINLGGLFAGVAAGSTAARFGWPAAFGLSAAAMAVAVLSFGALNGRLLGQAGARRAAEISSTEVGGRAVAVRLGALALLAALLCVYTIGSFQLWGTWSLVLEHHIDRHLGDFVIPTQWFTSLNALGLIVAAPLLDALWGQLRTRGVDPSLVTRYALALALGGLSLGVFGLATLQGDGASWLLPAAAILLTAVAEVVAWTTTYGAIYRIAPPAFTAAVVGGYYAATLGLGGYLAGAIGRSAAGIGYTAFFMILGGATLAAALFALLIAPALGRMLKRGGAEI